MRKLLTGLVVFLLAAVCFAGDLSGDPIVFRDPGDAWPWGAELPFPWKGIQGTWVAKLKGEDVYFKFVVVRSEDGYNKLRITEFLGGDCTIVARGAGFEQDRVVRAQMIGAPGAYNMTVHVFRQSDLRSSKAPGYTEVRGAKTITVMSLTPMSGAGARMTYQLYKIDPSPDAVCP